MKFYMKVTKDQKFTESNASNIFYDIDFDFNYYKLFLMEIFRGRRFKDFLEEAEKEKKKLEESYKQSKKQKKERDEKEKEKEKER